MRRPLKIEIDTLKNMFATANAEVDMFQDRKDLDDAEIDDEMPGRVKLDELLEETGDELDE